MTWRLILAAVFVTVWAFVTGSFSIPNLLLGLVIGGVAVWLVREGEPMAPVRIRPLKVAGLFVLFVVELFKSAVRVGALVLKRDLKVTAAIVSYPLRVDSAFEITLLANLITLTPGTMSIDVSDDRRTLFIHCVDAPDPEAVILDIRNGFEARILEAFR